MTDHQPERGDNEVFLRGVLAAEPLVRTLPSGDELCAFRLTVVRPPGGRIRVDSIDCSTTKPAARRAIERYAAGDLLEVTGRLHRRFWRTPAGSPASRYEVDVGTVRPARNGKRRPAKPRAG